MSDIILYTIISLLPILLSLIFPFSVAIIFSPILGFLILRIHFILPSTNTQSRRPKPSTRTSGTPTRLLVVLGSGGHTSEMLHIIRELDTRKWTHRTYVVSEGDAFSAARATTFEKELLAFHEKMKPNAGTKIAERHVSLEDGGTYDIAIVPRARRIHQPILTTPFSALRCFYASLFVLGPPRRSNIRSPRGSQPSESTTLSMIPPHPHLVLTNGPATGVIIVVASLVLRLLGIINSSWPRCIYIESWARVRKLSLSGKILLRLGLVERFLVQWKRLAETAGGEFVEGLIE